MLVLDANLWVAAFDAQDRFHEESVHVFSLAADRELPLAGPAFVLLETACALARRLGDLAVAREAAAKMAAHPGLHLVPMTPALLAEARDLGLARRLRGADALYAATAAQLGRPLLSWDSELIERASALSPPGWVASL